MDGQTITRMKDKNADFRKTNEISLDTLESSKMKINSSLKSVLPWQDFLSGVTPGVQGRRKNKIHRCQSSQWLD